MTQHTRPAIAISAIAISLIAISLIAAGCSDDGRTLAPAQPHQTQSVVDPTTTIAPNPDAVPTTLSVTVNWSDPTNPGELDTMHSCDGSGVAPEVRWAGVPAAAVEMAIAVVDLDAQGYVHWVLSGLDPLGFVPAGQTPPSALALSNGSGSIGWAPPCPPEGSAHRYQLTLYALSAPGLADAATASEAIEYLDGEAISVVDVVVRYAR